MKIYIISFIFLLSLLSIVSALNVNIQLPSSSGTTTINQTNVTNQYYNVTNNITNNYTVNPAGSNTQLQFNNNGSFWGALISYNSTDLRTYFGDGVFNNTYDFYGAKINFTKTMTMTFVSPTGVGGYTKAGDTWQTILVGKRTVGGYVAYTSYANSSVLSDATAPSDPFYINMSWELPQDPNVQYYLMQFKNGVFYRYRNSGFSPHGFTSSNGEGGWNTTDPRGINFPNPPTPTFYYSSDTKFWGDVIIQEALSILGEFTVGGLTSNGNVLINGTLTTTGQSTFDDVRLEDIVWGTAFTGGGITTANNWQAFTWDASNRLTIGGNGGDAGEVHLQTPFGNSLTFSSDSNIYSTALISDSLYSNNGIGSYSEASTTLTGTTDANLATTITGTGTAFLSEVDVGDVIVLTDFTEYGTVTAIASDTSLTVDTAIGDGSTQTIEIINGFNTFASSYNGDVIGMTNDGRLLSGDGNAWIKLYQGARSGDINIQTTNLSINKGTETVYRCVGGALDGTLTVNTGIACTAGTWTATSLRLD